MDVVGGEVWQLEDECFDNAWIRLGSMGMASPFDLITSLLDHQEHQQRLFSCPSCISWLIQLPIIQVRERLQIGFR